jgi:hypothetical protein
MPTNHPANHQTAGQQPPSALHPAPRLTRVICRTLRPGETYQAAESSDDSWDDTYGS